MNVRKRALAGLCLLCAFLSVPAGCGQTADKEGNPVSLTQEEVDRANEAFASIVETSEGIFCASEISCFFTSHYGSPEEIDFENFLYNCPAGVVLEDSDAAEFQAVISADAPLSDSTLPSEYPVPVHRYRKEEVSALLETYAGITVDALNSTEGVLYLEEYDSFYNFTSDSGAGIFQCVGGEKTGDMVRLWSDTSGYDGSMSVLTLQNVDGKYLIQSLERVALEG